MKSLLAPLAAVASVALMIAGATPAFAHEEIRPDTVPTGKPTFFTLFAANEKEVDLTKVVVTAPAGIKLGESTRSPAGWKADATGTSVTWTGGNVAPGSFDEWGFEIDGADQPGTLSFKVTMTAGASEDVTVPVTVVAAGSTQPGGTATTASGSSASPTTTASPPVTLQAIAPIGHSDSKSNWALGLAIAALVLGLLSLLAALTGRRSRSTTPPAAQPQDF